MAMQAYDAAGAGFFGSNLGLQQLAAGLNQVGDQLLKDSGIDTMNVQDMHRLIVKADSDDDYAKQMEELQEKLKRLEEEKEKEKQEALERERQ